MEINNDDIQCGSTTWAMPPLNGLQRCDPCVNDMHWQLGSLTSLYHRHCITMDSQSSNHSLTFHSQAKEVIFSLYYYFLEEKANQGPFNLTNMIHTWNFVSVHVTKTRQFMGNALEVLTRWPDYSDVNAWFSMLGLHYI